MLHSIICLQISYQVKNLLCTFGFLHDRIYKTTLHRGSDCDMLWLIKRKEGGGGVVAVATCCDWAVYLSMPTSVQVMYTTGWNVSWSLFGKIIILVTLFGNFYIFCLHILRNILRSTGGPNLTVPKWNQAVKSTTSYIIYYCLIL